MDSLRAVHFFGGPQAEVRPTKKIKSHVIEFFGGPHFGLRPTKKMDSTQTPLEKSTPPSLKYFRLVQRSVKKYSFTTHC